MGGGYHYHVLKYMCQTIGTDNIPLIWIKNIIFWTFLDRKKISRQSHDSLIPTPNLNDSLVRHSAAIVQGKKLVLCH